MAAPPGVAPTVSPGLDDDAAIEATATARTWSA